MERQVIVYRVFVTTPEQPRSTESMQFAIGSDGFHIADLKGLVPRFAITDPKHGVAKVTLVFAVIEFDGPGNAGNASRGLIFGRFEKSGFAALKRDQHLVTPSDGSLQRFGPVAP